MSFNPITGTDSAAALAMAQKVVGSQSGVTVLSAQYVGAAAAASTFDAVDLGTADGKSLTLGSGVLLTSGDGVPASSNTASDYTLDNYTAGDTGLDGYAAAAFTDAGATEDAAVLEIAFAVANLPDGTVPSKVSLDFMFGSDEYPEYSDSPYVDIAAIEVDGVNYAYFNQDKKQPLSVIDNNISLGNFVDNQAGVLSVEYDGISAPFRITTSLDAQLTTHTIRIAIADTGDTILDSAIFVSNLKTSSFDQLPDGIYVEGEQIVIPGKSGDSYYGSDDNDTITAGTGSDSIFGGLGDDTIDAGAGNDKIYGGAGDDTLVGGTGSDYMEGGSGADTYYVDNKKDVVKETSNTPEETSALVLHVDLGSTVDTVISSVKHTLTSYVENLTLADGGKGKAAGTGNELGNVLAGNSTANKLSGADGDDTIDGGAGADKISGGAGRDTFKFSNLASGGADTISDFTEEDVLAFDVSVFTALAGATGANYTTYLIFGKGTVSYDADGAGGGSAIKIVALKGADASTVTFEDLAFY